MAAATAVTRDTCPGQHLGEYLGPRLSFVRARRPALRLERKRPPLLLWPALLLWRGLWRALAKLWRATGGGRPSGDCNLGEICGDLVAEHEADAPVVVVRVLLLLCSRVPWCTVRHYNNTAQQQDRPVLDAGNAPRARRRRHQLRLPRRRALRHCCCAGCCCAGCFWAGCCWAGCCCGSPGERATI